jgi:Acetylornithine deacetylase/Succinyl-diaminopimelate desuccinylase and related deacylases
MKGGCASLIAALASIIDEGLDPAVSLAFVCDEEVGGPHGIHHLLNKELLLPSDCIIAEPTPSIAPCIGQKGLCRFTIEFKGSPGHSSLYPAVGKSAIMDAMEFLEYLKQIHKREFPIDPTMSGLISHSETVLEGIFQTSDLRSVMTRIMYNPGVISGGEKANIVPRNAGLKLISAFPSDVMLMNS